MLRFSERIRLCTAYDIWLLNIRKETPVADCTETFIIFLLTHEMIDEESVRKFLKNNS